MISPLGALLIAIGALGAGIALGLLWTCRNVHGEHSAYDPAFSVDALIDRVRTEMVHSGQASVGRGGSDAVTEPVYRVSVRLASEPGQVDPAEFWRNPPQPATTYRPRHSLPEPDHSCWTPPELVDAAG